MCMVIPLLAWSKQCDVIVPTPIKHETVLMLARYRGSSLWRLHDEEEENIHTWCLVLVGGVLLPY